MTGRIDMRAVGERVARLRRQAGLSQHGLAAKAGVDVMLISRLERGEKKRLEGDSIVGLAQALGVPIAQFLGVDDPRPPKRPRRRTPAPVG
jgi:transcriptional regulator with XRE-family HTH domain